MTKHLFISSKGQLQPRWRSAFPDAVVRTALGGGRPDVLWWACVPLNSAELSSAIAALPGVPVVVLSPEPVQEDAMHAIALGARGYCHSHATPAMLQQVAVAVTHGGLWLGPELMSRLMGAASERLLGEHPAEVDPGLDLLTPRERAVALEVARGATNKEAARRLDITERTVKAHLGAAFEKLGVRDRLQLVLALKYVPVDVDHAA
ncbi:response regulator transcription factor [Denitromonas ohlonensis]|uniref:Response regulator transcription factor n=2 Tax=Denitromonas TaxID=139331 RepID=A0A557SFM5_9RHOO|nr:response regulator transcription factor [Denitromonas ohlonensis]TVT47533.1 MAG: response regulator transcription factor [Denitromonas halophila]TVO63236.1 response regulator transcription factor [Denitromonas ohlonensis]TVO76218.1 response regulator transcription factor [Denitromonas ohlonensis]TVT69966.1 MAG: response regulator transcription factor [Denitromonas halophila]TVT77605.1 MAG: response regulator transcription factor [Denitromonas halophila]